MRAMSEFDEYLKRFDPFRFKEQPDHKEPSAYGLDSFVRLKGTSWIGVTSGHCGAFAQCPDPFVTAAKGLVEIPKLDIERDDYEEIGWLDSKGFSALRAFPKSWRLIAKIVGSQITVDASKWVRGESERIFTNASIDLPLSVSDALDDRRVAFRLDLLRLCCEFIWRHSPLAFVRVHKHHDIELKPILISPAANPSKGAPVAVLMPYRAW